MSSLEDLITVQALDTRADQLRHRRSTLPERQELADAGRALVGAEEVESEAGSRLRGLRAAQKEAEDHASLLEDKATAVNTSMYDGSVVAHKELEALQVELRMLKDHQREYEDQAIELMEAAEPVEVEVAACAVAVADLRTRIGDIEQRIVVAEAELDAELDDVSAERDAAAAQVPPEILSAYDTLRRQLGGVGAARLVGARCEGCHLEIPSAQLEAVRHAAPDALVTCPECLRILVR